MPEESPKLTIDFKKYGVVLGVVATFLSITGLAISNFQNYHEKYALIEDLAATKQQLDEQIIDLNKEIIILAIQSKEDQLGLISYKIATNQATDLDLANKETVERRLADYKEKLDKLDQYTIATSSTSISWREIASDAVLFG